MSGFSWPVRIYYEDTDSGGVVYYANYLKFMERARTEWLRQYGFEQDVMRRDQGVMFAVRSVQADFLKPARFNDLLAVTAEVTEKRSASLTFAQQVICNENTPLVLCTGQIRIACIDAERLRPCPIPKEILEVIPDVG